MLGNMFPPGDLWFGSDTEPEMFRYKINFAFPILLATFDIWYLLIIPAKFLDVFTVRQYRNRQQSVYLLFAWSVSMSILAGFWPL